MHTQTHKTTPTKNKHTLNLIPKCFAHHFFAQDTTSPTRPTHNTTLGIRSNDLFSHQHRTGLRSKMWMVSQKIKTSGLGFECLKRL